MKKVFYVKRNDDKHGGSIVEIPLQSLGGTLRLHPTWRVVEESNDMEINSIVPVAPKQPMYHCPLCGLESKSEHGLKVHKARKHG